MISSLKEHHFIQKMIDSGQLSKNIKLHNFILRRLQLDH